MPIRSGAAYLAAVIGTTAILVLMFLAYGRFGMYANIALVINIADDPWRHGDGQHHADAARYCRFRADHRRSGGRQRADQRTHSRRTEAGRRVVQAIEIGYKEASRAIFDANSTNVIAAVLMFIFGSGPIRGFAVVSDDRHRHIGLHGRHADPHVGRRLGETHPSARIGYLR